MDNANPVGHPGVDDGLTKADRVRKCLGNMGTSGTGKTWYVARSRTTYSKSAIVAVSLGTSRSTCADYPKCSISLLSDYPARTRRWIIEKYKIPMNNAYKKPLLGPLSKDEYKRRMPQKPEDLVDALNDSIHRDVGRSRPARASSYMIDRATE